MKGTMSELELSLLRQRSQEALKQKARRGALFLGVAAGYVKTGRDRIEKDPDQRVQNALQLVFSKPLLEVVWVDFGLFRSLEDREFLAGCLRPYCGIVPMAARRAPRAAAVKDGA